jgi:methylated-DNA-protein-cysteine methyltransferase-like protein
MSSGNRIPIVDARFRQLVYEIVRLVPYGQVTTYGFISTLAGMPRHARQVGWALHTLPAELVWGQETDGRRARPAAQADAGTAGRPTAAQRQGAAGAEREAKLGRVPWHRVVNAKGQVSSHPDDAGTLRQIELLRGEGIEVADDGAILGGLAAHQWQPDPATVDDLELPVEVLYALDRLIDR